MQKPKISANKLGEYITEKPHRQQQIIKDQKYQKGFIIKRYNKARNVIINFLTKKIDKNALLLEIQNLITEEYSRNASSFQKQDNKLSIEALEIFANSDLLELPEFENLENIRLRKSNNNLLIEGVEVSVHPDILICGKIRNKKFIGGIKLHISKSHPLKKEAGEYVATVLHEYLEKEFPKSRVKTQFCISIDVFTGEYFIAPKTYKTMKKNIKAACSAIQLFWENI
ncbi:MAG: hypothetical protein O9340_11300 [Cyclobacteriaceae bacterium]|jgi:hypothetical protein|nr:hypothetical protein [Cyclobacteriaceae bacterium]